jgi:hypothetical protein
VEVHIAPEAPERKNPSSPARAAYVEAEHGKAGFAHRRLDQGQGRLRDDEDLAARCLLRVLPRSQIAPEVVARTRAAQRDVALPADEASAFHRDLESLQLI